MLQPLIDSHGLPFIIILFILWSVGSIMFYVGEMRTKAGRRQARRFAIAGFLLFVGACIPIVIHAYKYF